MKILFAAPDRDLLECFGKLLKSDGFEVVTAFDGTQVLFLLSNERFDLVVLDRDLPRIACGKLLARSRQKELPSVILTVPATTADRPTDGLQPDAVLPYPFTAEQLENVIRQTAAKAALQKTEGADENE